MEKIGLEVFMQKNPPGPHQTYNCYLCSIVPEGEVCKACPAFTGEGCEVFEEKTYGTKLPTCKEKIRRFKE